VTHAIDRRATTLPISRLRHLPKRQWSNWCVGIYPTRRPSAFAATTLDILRPHIQDAVDEAKQAIDRALEPAKVA
jgi:hypothetical protein